MTSELTRVGWGVRVSLREECKGIRSACFRSEVLQFVGLYACIMMYVYLVTHCD